MQGVANRLPTEDMPAAPEAIPAARKKRERGQDAILEAAQRRECCSLPQNWDEEEVDEASWGFVVALRHRAEILDERGVADGDRVIFTAGGKVRTQPNDEQWGWVD